MPLEKSNQLDSNNLMLFTDGSVDVKTGIGYGAYLTVPNLDRPLEKIKKEVQVRRFENTSSTRLELETLLWALKNIPLNKKDIEIYTDSQNIMGLPARRSRLEQADYYSKNNRLIKNHDLYREFYKMMDQINLILKKARGHQPTHRKDFIHELFTIVDKASRSALRLNNRDCLP